MAILQVHFISSALKRTVPMTVILPVDKIFTDSDTAGLRPFKTLYLLHGLLGNCTDWVCNTRIQQWAQALDLAVVMPSGDNSFYVDQLTPNSDYGDFIGRELVEITRKMFPLSRNREDTFLAGLSMGGFGAIRNGLVYADTFGYVAGLSSAIHIFEFPVGDPRRSILIGEDLVFGDLSAARLTNANPRIALAQCLEKGLSLPKFYLSCGLQDSLLEANRSFKTFLEEHGADLTYVEAEGVHDWDFWNDQIQQVLAWLPLQSTGEGLNSGNITG